MVGIAGALLWSAAMFAAGWAWRGDRAGAADARQQAGASAAVVQQVNDTRATEHAQAQATQAVADTADTQEEKIDADYQERLAAALAGRDSELGRLRQQWAGCETARLSDPASAAAAAAEEDRLRRASAARVVRACELAQSERDEAVDRYQAALAQTMM
ncbi:hypothetical protein HF319_00695 [Xanthomonas sp. Kuri4-1]